MVLVPSSQQLLVFDRTIADLCPDEIVDSDQWRDLTALPADLRDAIETFIEPAAEQPPAAERLMPRPAAPPRCWSAQVDRLTLHFAVDDAALAAMLTKLFPPAPAAIDGSSIQIAIRGDGAAASVIVDGECVLAMESADLAIGAISQAIVARLHTDTPLLATLHASAAALGDRGLVFAAPSGSGKSTLIAYLSQNGFDYLGDDLAALSQDGDLLPWPAAMSIKPGSWNLLRSFYPALDDAASQDVRGKRVRLLRPARPRSTPVPLRAILFPRYEAGAEPRLTPITPLETLARLVNDRVWIGYPLREDAIDRLLGLILRTPRHQLVYDQLEDAAALVGTQSGPM
ncbi:hypothetical protein [Flavisphingomonas formosensis]|uniref:hypothetical protein n=1 Tax=Flavisphingomonas formosensis TaxID=861534 RepID=UPI0012FB4D26|nr:hypothetical protein [Sphingomonas formosensis]